jgi:hypothetical protein
MDSLIDQRDFFLKIGDTDGAKKANEEIVALMKASKESMQEAQKKEMATGAKKASNDKLLMDLESDDDDATEDENLSS